MNMNPEDKYASDIAFTAVGEGDPGAERLA
jgi:hypothetical protein